MTNKEHDPVRIQLLLGILGFVGVLITAAVAIYAPIIQENIRQKNLPTQTPIIIIATATVASPVPTDTVPPNEPTSTPAPTDTPTPEPTFTPVPLEAGQDWLANCISTVWKVFPESTGFTTKDGCYTRPLANVFSARSERLEVFFDGRVGSDEVVGIFVEIPSDSLVSFTTHLNNIENGELWMGIFADKNLDAKGLVLAAPEGNMKNSAFAVRTLPGNDKYLTGKFKKDSGDYLVSFDVTPNSVNAILEIYNSVGTASVPSETKWLFLGYKASPGGSNVISGYFSNLVINPR